jgi:hypothetical protein
MAVEIYFGDEAMGPPLRAVGMYSKEALALALSGVEQQEGRVGNFQRVSLDTGYEVLINPMAVTYLRETTP